jgi:hypothetical protein
MVVILWLSVVMIKDRFGQPGSVSLTLNIELKSKSVQLIFIRIVSLSEVCTLRNNRAFINLCYKLFVPYDNCINN